MSSRDLANAALREVTLFRDLMAQKSIDLKVAWDIGGNVGLYAIALADVFPGIRVHTFEPVQENLAVLRQNIIANKLDSRIFIHPVGISDVRQQVSLGIPKHRESENTGLFSVHYATQDVGKDIVHDCTLVDGDESLALAGEAPDIVKIDVEGSEMQVLDAIESMASKISAIIVEVAEDPRFRRPDDVNHKLFSMGFKPLHPDLNFVAPVGKRGKKAFNRLWVAARI